MTGDSMYWRAWPIEEVDLAPFPALKASRAYSRTILNQMSACVGPMTGLHSLAVAGSLGRLEAMKESDCDLIIIVDDDLGGDPTATTELVESVWECLGPLSLKRPKNWGIFTTATCPKDLCDPNALGALDEDMLTYGKRMQLLLDSQPVYGGAGFYQLLFDLITWSRTAASARESDVPDVYLINELIRYFKSYAAWQQFKFSVEDDENWWLRDIKLRFSRRLMYAALLAVLIANDIDQGGIESLAERLKWPPMVRLGMVAESHQRATLPRILRAYETFQGTMNDLSRRAELLHQAPTSIEELTSQDPPRRHQELVTASNEFADAIWELIDALMQKASPGLKRSLLF